jgi:hypothetical protein
MEIPNMTYSTNNSYRFGFGKENDNEVKEMGTNMIMDLEFMIPAWGSF